MLPSTSVTVNWPEPLKLATSDSSAVKDGSPTTWITTEQSAPVHATNALPLPSSAEPMPVMLMEEVRCTVRCDPPFR